MPLPTGAFSRKRVPNASPRNGSNTSADVHGSMLRVSESWSTRTFTGSPFQYTSSPAARLAAVVRERDVRPLADWKRLDRLHRDHVRGRRVCERQPEPAVADIEAVTGAPGILLGEMIDDRNVVVRFRRVEPEVDRERIGAVVPADVAPEEASISLVEEQRLSLDAVAESRGLNDGRRDALRLRGR